MPETDPEISEELKSKSFSNGAKFMQPLIPGFLKTFSIPVSFLERLKADGHQPETMLLVADDKRNWPIKLEGGRHFGDGWKEFALQHDLGVGCFLVFTHLCNLIFNVTIFDPTTACARQYYPFSHDFNCEGIKKTNGLKFNDRFTHKRNPVKDEADEASTAQVPSAESLYPTSRVTLTSSGFKSAPVSLLLCFNFKQIHHSYISIPNNGPYFFPTL